MSSLSIDDKLASSFMAANGYYPYFATGLATLVRRLVELPSATMAVTRSGILLVDPRFVERCKVPEIGEVLVHELQHILRGHSERSDLVPAVDRQRWNVAADCEVNCGLRRHLLPGEPCLPSSYGLPDGLLAEEYYEKLPIKITGGSVVCSGSCGSGSGGEVVAGEPPEGDGEGRSSTDLARMRREVAAAVLDHESRHAGNVPGDLLRWARGELRPPRVRWRDVLRRYVRSRLSWSSGKSDYTWSRPGRRQACQQEASMSLGGEAVVLPSLRGRIPRTAVGVDTSGSMGEAELAVAMSEVEGVLRAVGTPTVFLACDCAVQGPPREVRCAAEAVRSLRGGGGTDFRVVMAEVERLRPRPDLFVFLTDGEGPAPAEPPVGFDVLWVLIGEGATKPSSWGESVAVREDKPT